MLCVQLVISCCWLFLCCCSEIDTLVRDTLILLEGRSEKPQEAFCRRCGEMKSLNGEDKDKEGPIINFRNLQLGGVVVVRYK